LAKLHERKRTTIGLSSYFRKYFFESGFSFGRQKYETGQQLKIFYDADNLANLVVDDKHISTKTNIILIAVFISGFISLTFGVIELFQAIGSFLAVILRQCN